MIGHIENVLAALNAAEVRYLVVGGVAVVLHGYLRTTQDLDLVIHLERENLLRALQAFEGLGFQPLVPVAMTDFAESANREKWIQEKNMIVFSLWHPQEPTRKVDIFVSEPFDFHETYRRSVRMDLGNTEAFVVPLGLTGHQILDCHSREKGPRAMSESSDPITSFYSDSDDWGSHEANRRLEIEIGLSLTPAERLLWLEKTLEEVRPLVGLAQFGKPVQA